MKKYRTRFCYIGAGTGKLFFALEYNEGNGWRELCDSRWPADDAERLIREIVAGEKEWSLVEVKSFRI